MSAAKHDNDEGQQGTPERHSTPDPAGTEAFQPLGDYVQKAAGMSSSRFLESHRHPVLLYSQNPRWLEDLRSRFDTLELEASIEQLLSVPAETESFKAEIQVVNIVKHKSSPPLNKICVGRADNNDIVFANSAISKLHVYLLKTESGDSYEIVDVNSTNGTTVNGQELVASESQTLVNLDRIEFGKVIRAVYLTPRGFSEFLQHLIGSDDI